MIMSGRSPREWQRIERKNYKRETAYGYLILTKTAAQCKMGEKFDDLWRIVR